MFGVESPARKYLTGIIEFAVRRTPRLQTVAVSAASDPFSREVQQGAIQSANDHGLRVVYTGQHGDDAASIDRAATAIAAAHPDIILNAGHLQDALAIHRAHGSKPTPGRRSRRSWSLLVDESDSRWKRRAFAVRLRGVISTPARVRA